MGVTVKPPLELQEREVKRAQEFGVGQVGAGLLEAGDRPLRLERFALVRIRYHFSQPPCLRELNESQSHNIRYSLHRRGFGDVDEE